MLDKAFAERILHDYKVRRIHFLSSRKKGFSGNLLGIFPNMWSVIFKTNGNLKISFRVLFLKIPFQGVCELCITSQTTAQKCWITKNKQNTFNCLNRECLLSSSQDIFKQATEDRLTSANELPYFEGDFWPNVLEESIKELEQEEEERKKEENTAASETPEVRTCIMIC